jgi:hypothetical protein
LLGKKIGSKNGFRRVNLHSLQGVYSFDNQRYIKEDGSHSSFLEEIGGASSGRYSEGLDNFICKWSNELSYEKLSELLRELTGVKQLTKNGLEEYIIQKAVGISRDMQEKSLGVAYGSILISEEIDIYDGDSEEVILMIDDVLVKAQKPHKKVAREEEDAKRIGVTVAIISDKSGAYHTFTEGIDAQGEVIYAIEDAIQDKIMELHSDEDKPLPLVAITDGARSIRLSLEKVFGLMVCIILDWYHLCHKLRALMSMIACNKEDKALYITDLTKLLWNGKVQEALSYLADMPRIKNAEKHQELVGYIEKHAKEIIDYEKRQKAGKTIGSGRCEKANDVIVARRQKKKGMAWAKNGAKALAIVKVYMLNKKAAA